jgi:hypothetical protein
MHLSRFLSVGVVGVVAEQKKGAMASSSRMDKAAMYTTMMVHPDTLTDAVRWLQGVCFLLVFLVLSGTRETNTQAITHEK